MIGQTLGHYRIVEKIGEGGMGVVYLAEDSRLRRRVALKVLPAEFASDPERLARFEREARAAALNHPHIAAVYDVGAEGLTRFCVQEYLEGETLRVYLQRQRLPLKRTLEVAIEILEALTAAHMAGIVHRDLKPENIFVRTDGHIKVLDFGLAKLVESAVAPADPTATKSLTTSAGRVLGTVGYMAPEQIEGRTVDPRTDLFAFGCMLYEMVTGQGPFAGRSSVETLHKILHEEPAPILDTTLPAELSRILRKCLAKEPGERYQHADDLLVDLRQLGRELESGVAARVAAPLFSPDGQWVGFFAGGKLKKVSLRGGAPLTLCEAPDSRGASWGEDDAIVFAPSPAGGLWRIVAAGKQARQLTQPDVAASEVTHRWPEVLPGAKAVIYTVGTAGSASYDEARIVVQSLETGKRRTLIEGGSNPRYVPTGHLVFARGGALLAVPFDPVGLEVTGPVTPILDGAMMETTGAGEWTLSSTGTLAYVPGRVRQPQRTLVWVDRNGRARPVSEAARVFEEPRLSPDGRRLAVGIRGATSDIWILEFARGTLTRLTFEGDNFAPIWTPDGKRVTFASNRAGPSNIFWAAADGSGKAERLLASEYDQVASSWSRDGKQLAFTEYHPESGADLWVLSWPGKRRATPFLRTPFNEWGAVFSPDGRWLAYTSDETGRPEVYLQPFPGPGAKVQVSTEGGTEPLWVRRGQELIYRTGEQVMTVRVRTKPTLRTSPPRVLFRGAYAGSSAVYLPNFDVTADGRRFLFIQTSEQETTVSQLEVVLGWFGELRRPRA